VQESILLGAGGVIGDGQIYEYGYQAHQDSEIMNDLKELGLFLKPNPDEDPHWWPLTEEGKAAALYFGQFIK
jgi:hypothetical protein